MNEQEQRSAASAGASAPQSPADEAGRIAAGCYFRGPALALGALLLDGQCHPHGRSGSRAAC